MDEALEAVLREQVVYYRARAGEYDEAYAERMGLQALWDEVTLSGIEGEVLELACGTGQWTRHLVGRAGTVTALDAAPEMLTVAKERVANTSATFVEADVFSGSRSGGTTQYSLPSGSPMFRGATSPRSGPCFARR